MKTILPHEVGAFDHAGVRLPRKATALQVWRLVRRPMKLRRISAIVSTAHSLSLAVRAALKARALQSLVIALDCVVQSGRAERPLTTNRFMESLGLRWSRIYRQTRRTQGTGRLADFKPETVVAIREEIVGQGIAYQKLWKKIRGGVPGLYTTSAPIKNRGRTIKLVDDDERPLPLLADFDKLLDGARYRRDPDRRVRLLLANDPTPPRKISQHVAGELPFDVMCVGEKTENVLQRLEAARVFLRVPELLEDIKRMEAKLAVAKWPAILREWEWIVKPVALADLDVPEPAPKRATNEARFWRDVERRLTRKFQQAAVKSAWRDYMAVGDRQQERNRYRSTRGRLAAANAIDRQRRERGIADDASVEIKSSFFKHRTRRFQAVNVWPSEASSGEETIRTIDQETSEILVELAALRGTKLAAPRALSTPQRVRWFGVRAFHQTIPGAEPDPAPEFGPQPLDQFFGLDISGSQAQILAVVMGLREVETQLGQMPFKQVVALSIRALQRQGKIRIPPGLLENDTWLANTAKDSGMPGLYGGRPHNIASELQRDPDRYGPGLDAEGVKSLFAHDPTIRQLRAFLPVCEALGHAACEASETAGVTVADPIDGTPFTWNQPKRAKVQLRSGAFKLYVYPPRLHGDAPIVNEQKLMRRIAPGLVHAIDAFYASIVIRLLNSANVRDVVAIHDAFLVPASARTELKAAIKMAGPLWMPKLGPLYDAFEKYLPEDYVYRPKKKPPLAVGKIVRRWRVRWEQRVKDCESGKDTWPTFLTKHEGPEFQ